MTRETVQFDDMCSHKMFSRLKNFTWLAAFYSTFSSEIREEVAFYKNSQGFSFYIPALTYTVYLFDIFYFPMTQALLKFA